MSAIPVIAIFDVGKTNKKIFLFDEGYRIVYEHTDKFAETSDEDGDACEDLDLLTGWCKDSFRKLFTLKDFSIKAINFSAYGASFVHIGSEGTPVLPLYNYLKPYPEALKKKFFDEYGGERSVSMITASPVLDSLNSGLQLYRLKYEKDVLASGGYSLHLPQYLSYLITGKAYSDITSIGCHTMLWDFTKDRYHDWVMKEKIESRLAPLFSCDAIMDANGLPAGVGLHDSSAALIPYLSGFHQPFILISTGTWCISVNPFNEAPLTARELEQDCLCYITYKGKPVKASRLFAGHEHEQQVKLLAAHFDKRINYFETVSYNRNTIKYLREQHVQDSPQYFSPGPSAFKHRQLDGFRNYEEAYHQLIMDIISQQVLSTQLVMQGMTAKRLFVDGGFSKNPIYMNLLALAFPDLEVYAASVAQATAIGAALAIHSHWNQGSIPADLIDLKYYASGQEEEKSAGNR
jgi:sugar (pentulose or hexulose) kinase